MNELATPFWIKYAGDLFFLICFLVVFFFFKPVPGSDLDEDEDSQPNPLEKILKNDDAAALVDDEVENYEQKE